MAMFSLQRICLEKVIGSFDRFHLAYRKSVDPDVKKNLEFIRKCYSTSMLSMLSCRFKIKEDYAEFILNRYIKKLNADLLSHYSWETLVSRLAEIGNELEEFTVSCCIGEDLGPMLSLSAGTILPYMSNLKILHLEEICNNQTMLLISECCGNLVELNIKESPVTKMGFKHLQKNASLCSSLKVFGIKGIHVNDNDVEFLLENMPSLEIIEYKYLSRVLFSIHAQELRDKTLDKAKKYNLKRLYVRLYDDSEENYEALNICAAVCPLLEELVIWRTHQKVLDLLCIFPNLRRLTLKGYDNDVDPPDINKFLRKQGHNLTYLKIYHFQDIISVPKLVVSCPNLRELDIDLRDGKNVAGNLKFSFKKLMKLTISLTTAKYCIKTACCPVLSELNITYTDLSASDFSDNLSEFPVKPLKHMKFNFCELDMSFLQNVLNTFSTLETITANSITIRSRDKVRLYNVIGKTKYKPFLHLHGVKYKYC